MAHLQGASETIEDVGFGFMTAEEVRKHSMVKVVRPDCVEVKNGKRGEELSIPVPGGLYDPAFGPLDDDFSICKSCGQSAFHCPGHCGHIELVLPAYNPLLFNILHSLLERTCIYCCHFRMRREEVFQCISQLELVRKGVLTGEEEVDFESYSQFHHLEEGNGSKCDSLNHSKQQHWTSLQFTKAMSVLNGFLKPKPTKCKNCMLKNPSIAKPVFGWLHKTVKDADSRANTLRRCDIEGLSTSGYTEETYVEEINNDTDTDASTAPKEIQATATKSHRRKGGKVIAKHCEDKESRPLLPSEVKNILRQLWENEAEICSYICDIQQQKCQKKEGYMMFFLETILVPPIKFRPPSKGGDSVMEHPQTVLLSKVVQANIELANARSQSLEHSKIVGRWMALQQSINVMFDSSKATSGRKDVASGICQLLEKKEGMFRQKMMGKRVNYACRSVISPDPYLAVDEIGIPPYFAKRLTYPERVTPWNAAKLRDAIINGPDINPGATHVVDNSAPVKLKSSRKDRISAARKLLSSKGAAGKHSDSDFEGKFVYRHLQDGDIVLVNRQPTLHKPSIMAHRVRILPGEITIRMQYANCSTYNADFDGDEMNVHFPQDEISRAEAYNIVNANNQYVKPTSGDPIRALIQDHIVSAVFLTKKDTFLTQDEFNQLIYSSGLSTTRPSKQKLKHKVQSISDDTFVTPLPAIWKPVPLWTGKQVITALLNHITRGFQPFTVEKGSIIPRDFFNSRTDRDGPVKDRSKKEKKEKKGKAAGRDASMEKGAPVEDALFIYKNNLIRGVIDKAQFGKHGLVHTVQELYGSNTAGLLLSALSRIFTTFLQIHGFTCGVVDLLLAESKDRKMTKLLEKCEDVGKEVYGGFAKVKVDEEMDLMTLQCNIQKYVSNNGEESALEILDGRMIGQLRRKSEEIAGLLFECLYKLPSKNSISLMTTSGAKGAKVNFQQISSHLGQQELEGKRVPRMVSGKTLPCFRPCDWSPRAGGFITDRFLSGLHSPEYYFHCMAGREGLVDTTVKTSRSGYLQRCLIKNLESLKICYDHTVRDSDGSIIQFYYGEDGVDVHHTSFLANFEALIANREMISKKYCHQIDKSNPYVKDLPVALRQKALQFAEKFSLEQNTSLSLKEFLRLVEHKYLTSLAQPGEPVGVLAAQSIGEPSTQMTLNTFHFAGRGEMNVTLGIPRLQEILKTASRSIKTPIMTCPLLEGRSKEDAKSIADKLKKITVAEIVESMNVGVDLFFSEDGQCFQIHKLKIKLYMPEHYPSLPKDWVDVLKFDYVGELEDAIESHINLLSRISGIESFSDLQSKASNETDEEFSDKMSHGKEMDNDDDDVANDGDDGEVDDLGSSAQKWRQQAKDEIDYEDDLDDEVNVEDQSARLQGVNDKANNEVEYVKDDFQISDVEDEVPENLSKSVLEEDDIDCESYSEGEVDTADISAGLQGNNARENNVLESRKDNTAKNTSESELQEKMKNSNNKRRRREKKEYDRATYVAANGFHFEVHFKFQAYEPLILLTEIAQKVGKKVYIQKSGNVDMCQQITCKESQVIYYGRDPENWEDISPNEKEKVPALQTSGVDFGTFWKLLDLLDVRYIYSNDIHAMLNTYGVEAARATIIREITNVFKSYSISVNIRYLMLIADFMTHSGEYRPLSRHGRIADSVSPFSKMSFETASKFIIEAAYHGLTDTLDTPSSRICLGMPVKVGTGCFDLMQSFKL